MKFLSLLCVTIFAVGVSAQSSDGAIKVRADYQSEIRRFSSYILNHNAALFDGMSSNIEEYRNASSALLDQLSSVMQKLSVARNFSALYLYTTLSKHVAEVTLDLESHTTWQTMNQTSYRDFAEAVATAQMRFAIVEAAVDGNPQLEKCWFGVKEECVAEYGKIFLEQNPAIMDSIVETLNRKLKNLTRKVKKTFSNIESACRGSRRRKKALCIDKYVRS